MSDREIKPEVKDDPLFQMLRHEDVDSFNKHRDTMDCSQLTGGDYRGRDLRKMNARGLDFSARTSEIATYQASIFERPISKVPSISMQRYLGSIFRTS